MEIKELFKLKEEVLLKYNDELKQKDKSGNSNAIDEALNQIKKELDKIDELINIYKVDDIEYKVMKLERLYMQIMTEKTKEEFSNLTQEEEFNIFNNVFPKNWSFKVPINQKLEYLEKAICTNKLISQIEPNNKKSLKIIF